MKKRKGNNAQKRYRVMANSILKRNHVTIVYVSGNDGYSFMANRKTAQSIKVTPELSDVVTKISFKWSILIAALCRDDFGCEYMPAEQIDIDQPLLQADLADYLDDRHQKLVSSCNKKHVVGVAWAANPFGGDWDEEQASALFARFNGWAADHAEFMEKEVVG